MGKGEELEPFGQSRGNADSCLAEFERAGKVAPVLQFGRQFQQYRDVAALARQADKLAPCFP